VIAFETIIAILAWLLGGSVGLTVGTPNLQGRSQSLHPLIVGPTRVVTRFHEAVELAAGIADVPEASAPTSIKERVDQVAAQGPPRG
jgi:hypothetical protein